jgi:hypothetical protein
LTEIPSKVGSCSSEIEIASKGLAACYPLMGSLVSAGVTTFVTGTAAYSVSKANEAVDSRRSVAREVGHKMHNIAADFSMFSDEKKGLVSFKTAPRHFTIGSF